MVNVNKSISQTPEAPKRRPRNQALNSSRNSLSKNPVRARVLQKLNSSKSGWDDYFIKMTDQEVADHFDIPIEDMLEENKKLEESRYGTVVGHYVAKPEYEDVLEEYAYLDIMDNGTVGYALGEGGGKAVRFYSVDIGDIEAALKDRGSLDSSSRLNGSLRDKWASYYAGGDELRYPETSYEDARNTLLGDESGYEFLFDWYLDYTADLCDELGIVIDPRLDEVFNNFCDAMESSSTEDAFKKAYAEMVKFWEGNDWVTRSLDSSKTLNRSSRKLNSAAAQDTKVTTESGNEVSMSEIKVVQNPTTNELALYIPENSDDEIPEGFTVIGDVVNTSTETSEDSESEELDSSKQKKRIV